MEPKLSEFLSTQVSHTDRHDDIRPLETHISILFIGPEFVYKIKKPVKFDFLDFTTLEKRKYYCERELSLNRRFAPDIYLDVVPIYWKGRYSFEPPGEIAEYAVKMRRFDDHSLFTELLERGELTTEMLVEVTKEISAFHRKAKLTPDMWGPEKVWDAIDKSLLVIESNRNVISPELSTDLRKKFYQAFNHNRGLIVRRQKTHVRALHGDLHLKNIALFHKRPVLFDGIEFNDDLACIDCWADVAFLIMDLQYRGRPDLAVSVRNTYLEETDDFEGLRLLQLYSAYRAAVRAKVNLLQMQGKHDPEALSLAKSAKRHVKLALKYLSKSERRLIAIGGFSGSGKTTLGRALACKIDGVQIRTDVVRKHMLDLRPLQKAPTDTYTAEFSRKVYAEVRFRANCAIDAGFGVILDGVHGNEKERSDVRELASRIRVPFFGIWCEVDVEEAIARLTSRVNDASDATPGILRAQTAAATPPNDWFRLKTDRPIPDQIADLLAYLARPVA